MINKIDLSGVWQLCMLENSEEKPLYNDTIVLPNTTSNAKKGEYNSKESTGYLTDTYKFEGYAWFSRKVDFNKIECTYAKLFLERTRITTVYVDNEKVGTQESLCTPHVFDLTKFIGTGERTLSICVANVGYKTKGGHLTSPDTQTNWNGITGEISLHCFGESYVDNVMIKTDIHNKSCHVTADVVGKSEGSVTLCAESFNGNIVHKPEVKSFTYADSRLDIVYPMGDDCLLWSEHNPDLYKMEIEINGDISQYIIGMREFATKDGKFTINEKNTFLRGKHDGMIFPKTSFAPTDLDEWLRIMKISKSYGINHYRYHTCCPPENAFLAADMLGIYMEPQLPFWGTITADGEENHNQQEQDFLISEGFAMLKAFGNHPSYCMMSMGNELWGSKEVINDIMGGYKKFDDRHLYTQGSNNFQWFPNVVENDDFFVGVRLAKDRLIRGSYAMCDAPLGHIQTDKPAANHDYDSIIRPTKSASSTEVSENGTVKIQYGTTMKIVKASEADADFVPKVPIVTHEIGQYETYPDFNEIEKYTGSLKAKNFEIFRKRLEEKGLLSLARDYFECSGKLAVECYKEELESVFRSRLLGGFQILDIQDFSGQGTALVGILDAFMDSKGLITDKVWRGFCNDEVLLARFDSYTMEEQTEFNSHIELCRFRPGAIETKMIWKLSDGDKLIAQGSEKVAALENENYIDIADITIKLPAVKEITYLNFVVSLENSDVENSYELTVIPKTDKVDYSGVNIFKELDNEAEKLLKDGKTVLIVPSLDKLENSLEGMYCQDFWCYHMFSMISKMMKKPDPVGTMGLLIDNKHPALSEFNSKKYSTPQWYDIVMNSRSEIIDDCAEGKNVIIRTIDNFDRNHNLALMYEYEKYAGKVVVCNCDFDKLNLTSEGRLFIKSVVDYVRN